MEELKQKLINICNESELPLEAILFVARDFYRDVEDAYRNACTSLAVQQSQEEVKDE